MLVKSDVNDLSIRAGNIQYTLCAVLFQVIKKITQKTVFKRHLESFYNQERVLQVRRSRRFQQTKSSQTVAEED